MYQNFIIPYLYEAQHVSGDTPPIIRSLNLHWQPLVFHNTVEGCWTCIWWTLSGTVPTTMFTLRRYTTLFLYKFWFHFSLYSLDNERLRVITCLKKKILYLCRLEAEELVMVQSILDIMRSGSHGSGEIETFRLLSN